MLKERRILAFSRERQSPSPSCTYQANHINMTIMLIHVMISGTRSEAFFCLFLKRSNTNTSGDFLAFFLVRCLCSKLICSLTSVFLCVFQEGNQRGVHHLRMNSNQTLYIKVGDRKTVVCAYFITPLS